MMGVGPYDPCVGNEGVDDCEGISTSVYAGGGEDGLGEELVAAGVVGVVSMTAIVICNVVYKGSFSLSPSKLRVTPHTPEAFEVEADDVSNYSLIV